MKVENKQWIFSDFENAQKFAEYFKILNEKHYCGIPSAVMFKTTGEYMKYAFDKKYILPNDLNKTDDEVLAESTLDIKKISLRSGDILLIQYPTGLAPRYFEKLMKSLEPLKILFEKRNVHCLVAPNTITFTKIEQK